MIPLTVTYDHKYFIAYKVSDESLAKENELILVGMRADGGSVFSGHDREQG